jgi:hypothetical protein
VFMSERDEARAQIERQKASYTEAWKTQVKFMKKARDADNYLK